MANQDDLHLSPSGLWTAPAVIEAPRGALQQADEIVIRRAGVAEPRPGFSENVTDFPSSGFDSLERMLEHEQLDGSFEVMGVGKKTGAYLLAHAAGSAIFEIGRNTTTGAVTNMALTKWIRSQIWGVNDRGNLYLTAADGLRTYSGGNGAYTLDLAYRSGLRTPHLVLFSQATAGQALILNGYVTYRACLRFQDENGVIRRSGVSGRVLAGPGTGSGNQITLDVIGSLCVSGTSGVSLFGSPGVAIEIYRSENSLTYPPIDEHFYVGEVLLSDAENVTTGFTQFTDNILDVDLGVALYINATEQGAEANHVQIPTAGCATVFNGSLFLGNLSYAPSQVLYIPHSASLIGTSDTTSVGLRRRTSTLTSGSDQITAISDMTGLKVGMIVGLAPSDYTVNGFVRITALNVGASSATMSSVLAATGRTLTLSYFDSLVIDGVYFPIFVNLSGPTLLWTVAFIRGALLPGVFKTTAVPANVGSSTVQADLVGLDGQSGGYLNLYNLFADQTSAKSFTLQATHGAAYNPALPEPTATALTIHQQDVPNGLAWSNNLEPEHFTAPNEDQIAPNGKVLAMHALGNALLVFMDRGLWRVAGSGAESSFRFDQLDQDLRLIYPYAATRLKDVVYAHGDKGIHACDENAATPMTALNLRDKLQPVQDFYGAGATAPGFFAVTNRKADEVCFSVPSLSDANVGERLYVYNANTAAWTNWFVGSSMACGLAQTAGKVLSFFDTVKFAERLERIVDLNADKTGTATTAATGASVVLSGVSSGYTPEVGDLVISGSENYVILTVVGSTITVDRSFTPQGAGTATLAKSYSCVITPIASLAQAPGFTKVWAEGRLIFGSLEGVYQVALSCTSALSDSAVSQTRVLFSQRITRTAPETFRFVVPRNHARSTRLFPSLVIRQGGSSWRFEGLDIGYRISSDRVLRRR